METATKGGKKAVNLLAKHVDPPHPLGLLRADPERPHGRAADKRDDTATLRIAYRTDSRPFSFLDAQGQPTGYTIELCKRISKSLEGELAWNPAAVRSLLPTLAWSGKAVHFVSSSRSREDAAGLEGASRLSGSCHLIGRDGVAARTVTAHQLTESQQATTSPKTSAATSQPSDGHWDCNFISGCRSVVGEA